MQEYLDGADLRQWLVQQRKLSVLDAFGIMVPILGALASAHRRGIVHRDIKPENIFLSHGPEGEMVPKLIDFGISKVLDTDESLTMTRTGMVVGTPFYMSPEQARGETGLDARSDIWSVGAVLYEMLAGRCPFEAPNYNILIARIITEPPPRIEGVAPELPPDIAALIHSALEPSRDRRFQDMRQMIAAMLESSAFANDPSGLPPAVRFKGSIPSVADFAGRSSLSPANTSGEHSTMVASSPVTVPAGSGARSSPELHGVAYTCRPPVAPTMAMMVPQGTTSNPHGFSTTQGWAGAAMPPASIQPMPRKVPV